MRYPVIIYGQLCAIVGQSLAIAVSRSPARGEGEMKQSLSPTLGFLRCYAPRNRMPSGF